MRGQRLPDEVEALEEPPSQTVKRFDVNSTTFFRLRSVYLALGKQSDRLMRAYRRAPSERARDALAPQMTDTKRRLYDAWAAFEGHIKQTHKARHQA